MKTAFRQAFRQVFPQTIPVLAGYLSLGIAFGILLQSAGYGPLWALGMSFIIYAGSAQFLCVELLAAGAALSQVALLTFLLNFRHFFYGLSMITRYQNTGNHRFKRFLYGHHPDEPLLLGFRKCHRCCGRNFPSF